MGGVGELCVGGARLYAFLRVPTRLDAFLRVPTRLYTRQLRAGPKIGLRKTVAEPCQRTAHDEHP